MYMNNVVKSTKRFFGYFNTLETHGDTFATRYKKVQLKIAKLPYIGGPDSPDMMVLNVMKLIKF